MEAHSHLDGGWDDEDANYVTLAKAGGRKGNKMITIHF